MSKYLFLNIPHLRLTITSPGYCGVASNREVFVKTRAAFLTCILSGVMKDGERARKVALMMKHFQFDRTIQQQVKIRITVVSKMRKCVGG